jgi:hypothetical protein
MYLNDGTPHHDGIANEHYTIYMINHNPKLAPIREKLGYLIHKGGTHQNPDAMCLDTGVKVSLKNKESESGSFDWKNMSFVDDGFGAIHREITQYYKRYPEDEMGVRDMYKRLFHVISKTVDTSSMLNRVLDGHESDWIVLNFKKTREMILFHRDELTELWKNPGQCMVRNGCASGKIEGTPNLRMRVCLNNGVRALLGRGSSICVKIQQDQPPKALGSTQ